MSYTEAFSFITEFYTDKTKSVVASESFNTGILTFPKPSLFTRLISLQRQTYGSCCRFSKAGRDCTGPGDKISLGIQHRRRSPANQILFQVHHQSTYVAEQQHIEEFVGIFPNTVIWLLCTNLIKYLGKYTVMKLMILQKVP